MKFFEEGMGGEYNEMVKSQLTQFVVKDFKVSSQMKPQDEGGSSTFKAAGVGSNQATDVIMEEDQASIKVVSQMKPPEDGDSATSQDANVSNQAMEDLMEEDQESTSWTKGKERTLVKRNARGSREELASTSEEKTKRNPKKSRASPGKEWRKYPKGPGWNGTCH